MWSSGVRALGRRVGLALPWFLLLVACVSVLTLSDAFLLQLKAHYLSGGFLARHSLGSAFDVASFLLAAMALDATAVLAVWLPLLPLLRRLELSGRTERLVAGIAGVGVPLIFDIARYRLQSYLGDLVDLDLIVTLAGGLLRELLAQGSSYLLPFVLLSAGALLVVLFLLFFVPSGRGGAGREQRPSVAALGFWLCGCLVVSLLFLVPACLERSSLCHGLSLKPSGLALRAVVEASSDLDRDGFGLLSVPEDPDPLDASIHPHAIDWPGNAIDENGLGGDLPAEFRAEQPRPGPLPSWERRPWVLFVLLESFRFDVVGRRFRGSEITPHMNEAARSGASTDLAFALTPYTTMSRPQLLSGHAVPFAGQDTLIHDFKANGYYVAYFSAQDDSFGDNESMLGIDQVDHFYDARQDTERRSSRFTTPGSLNVSWKVLNEKVIEFLESYVSSKPLFLYVNYHDTHFPYHHRDLDEILTKQPLARDEIGPGQRDRLLETYLNAVANVDRAVGQLAALWEAAAGARERAILITADHGEALFEDGYLGHGQELSDAHTRVPLIVYGIGGDWPEPLLLTELRPLIQANLDLDPVARPPHFVPDPERQLFQYMPRIGDPRLFAFRGLDFSAFYDLHSGEFRVDGNPGASRDSLFRKLVWTWEALRLGERQEHTRR